MLRRVMCGATVAVAMLLAGLSEAQAQGSCERPTGRGARGCLGSALAVVDSSTNEVLAYRAITLTERGSTLKGLADAQGRQIVAPGFLELIPINRNWARARRSGMLEAVMIDLRTGAETPFSWGFNTFDFNGASLTLVSNNSRGQGDRARADMHLLDLEGQPGRSFPAVTWMMSLGAFLVLNHLDDATANQPDRPIAVSQWLDQSGQTVMTTPEVRLVWYRGAWVAAVAVTDVPLLRTALSPRLPYTYMLIGADGQDIDLPGVVGLSPIDDIGGLKVDPNIAYQGWVVARLSADGTREVRVTQGSLDHALDHPESGMIVDDGLILSESVETYQTRQNGLGRHVVVREQGGTWYLFPNWRSPREERFLTAQDAANHFNNSGLALAAQFEAERAVRRAAAEAEAAAVEQRRMDALTEFEALLRQYNSNTHQTLRGGLINAAMRAGGPAIERALELYPDIADTSDMVDRACQIDAWGCNLMADAHQAVREERAEARRRQFERQVATAARFAAMADPDPEVRVNIYENGQFRTQVMRRSHYQSVYQ